MPTPAKILFVDDEPMIRTLARTVLPRAGFAFLPAGNGMEAVERFTAERDTIDLVILDLTMPGMSGCETLAALRLIDPGVRVLITSGTAVADAPSEDLLSIAGFLEKPYRPDDLIAAVREALVADLPGIRPRRNG